MALVAENILVLAQGAVNTMSESLLL